MRFDDKFQLLDPSGEPLANVRYELVRENGSRTQGVSDVNGLIPLQQGFNADQFKIRVLGRMKKNPT